MNRQQVIDLLRKEPDLLQFLSQTCMAEYDTQTEEICYADPGDTQCRLGLEHYHRMHPDLPLRCVRDAFDVPDESKPLKPRTEAEMKRYISLNDLVRT
jgi:hypothetical protein